MLVINVDKTINLVQSTALYVQSLWAKDFQQQWCEGGSKRLQHSVVLEHAENMSHEKTFDLHLKGLGFGIQ